MSLTKGGSSRTSRKTSWLLPEDLVAVGDEEQSLTVRRSRSVCSRMRKPTSSRCRSGRPQGSGNVRAVARRQSLQQSPSGMALGRHRFEVGGPSVAMHHANDLARRAPPVGVAVDTRVVRLEFGLVPVLLECRRDPLDDPADCRPGRRARSIQGRRGALSASGWMTRHRRCGIESRSNSHAFAWRRVWDVSRDLDLRPEADEFVECSFLGRPV